MWQRRSAPRPSPSSRPKPWTSVMTTWPGPRSQTRPSRCSGPWPVREGPQGSPGLRVRPAHPAPCRTGRHWLPGGRAGPGKAGGALSTSCSQGDQFVFYEDWGENMASKSTPVLCVLDVESGNISVLEGVPESVSPGQVSPTPPTASGAGACLSTPLLTLPRGLAHRPSGPRETRAWCSWDGSTSPSGWASASAPTAGEGGEGAEGRAGRGWAFMPSERLCWFQVSPVLRGPHGGEVW